MVIITRNVRILAFCASRVDLIDFSGLLDASVEVNNDQSTANFGDAEAGGAFAAGVDFLADAAAVRDAGGGLAAAFFAAIEVIDAGGGLAAGFFAAVGGDIALSVLKSWR